MFDVFKLAARANVAKSTMIKAFGATIKCDGMPTSYTTEGLEQLVMQQPKAASVSLPKAEVNENLQGRTKLSAANAEQDKALRDLSINLIRGEMPEEGKKRVKAAKEEQTA